MNVNTQAWGSAFTEYSGLNVRTGAADINDPDFENYPPFVRNSFNVDTEIQYVPIGDLYYPYLDDNESINLNKPIERSIAYCACKNMDIPINKIWGYSCTPDSSSSQYPELTDTSAILLQSDNTPIPIMLLDTIGIGQARNHGMSANQHYFRNPFYRTSQGVFNQQTLWTQYAQNEDLNGVQGNPYDNTGRSHSNKNLFAAYYRDFGIRSMFLQIRVTYYNSIGSTTETPSGFNDKTLYWYSQQTAEWRESHPLTGAYGRLIVRNSTAGLYQQGNNVNPDITVNLKSNWNFSTVSIGDLIQQPIANVDTEYLQSAFPLFGVLAPNHWLTTETGTHASGGISQNVAILIGGGENSPIVHKQGKDGTQYKGTMWCEMEGTDENLELLRKWCAAYGLFFTDGDSGDTGYSQLYAAGNDSTRWTDEKMCLGVIDDEGFTDGTYTRGIGNETANNFDWKTVSESKYDPIKPPPTPDDPTIYSDETGFNVLGGVANCNKVYAVNASNIMNLAKALSTAITTRLSDLPPLDYSLETFLTNNPLDCVVSLRKYPVTNLSSGTEEPISFGSYQNANVQGIPFVKSYDLITFTFSNAARNSLYAHFADFRDYEPYTHAELIIPFCGTVQINPCDFIGHDINVYMVIDYITGGCTAYVAADRLVVTSIAGTIGVDVPLSGIQTATLESQRVNAVMSRKSADIGVNNAIVGGLSSSVGLLASAGAGSVVGAVGSGAGLVSSVGRIEQADIAYQKADYELKHQQVPFKQVSAGTPIASTVVENCCRLIIYRPVLDDRYNAEVYAKTVGFACLMNGKVADFSGLTVGNINVDGLAVTDTEKQAIQKAFANGVIL